MTLRRMLTLPVLALSLAVLLGALAAPAGAAPPEVLQATSKRVSQSFVPGSLQLSGPRVLHYGVLETFETAGDLTTTDSAEYKCVQVAEVIRCSGTAHSEGTVAGVEGRGTFRTHIRVTCELPALTCSGKTQIKGTGGALADLRGTGDFTATGGVSTYTVRITRW